MRQASSTLPSAWWWSELEGDWWGLVGHVKDMNVVCGIVPLIDCREWTGAQAGGEAGGWPFWIWRHFSSWALLALLAAPAVLTLVGGAFFISCLNESSLSCCVKLAVSSSEVEIWSPSERMLLTTSFSCKDRQSKKITSESLLFSYSSWMVRDYLIGEKRNSSGRLLCGGGFGSPRPDVLGTLDSVTQWALLTRQLDVQLSRRQHYPPPVQWLCSGGSLYCRRYCSGTYSLCWNIVVGFSITRG